MSDEDVMIDGRPLSSLKVTELKEELEKRQIFIKGVKAVLQDKLREAIAAQGDSNNGDSSKETRKRTESEASGTKTPQNNASPTKKPESSPSKRQTPKRGRKASQSKEVAVEEAAQESVDTAETVERKTENKITHESESSQKPDSTKAEETVEVSKNGKDSETEKQKEPGSPQQTEAKETEEKTQQDSPMTEDQKDEVVHVSPDRKEDDGDELDYGDDEEKEVKDDESRDSEDVKEENSKVVQIAEKNEKGDEGVKKEEKVREPVSHRRGSSPSSRSRHPVSNIVHIRGLTRPFTERQLRNEIEKHGGEIADFWIDKVKSHCFAKLNSDTDAGNVLKAMHDTVWPDGNPKKLAIVFESEENMTKYKEGRESTIVEAAKIGGRSDRVSSTSQASLVGGKASLQITLQNVLRDNDKLDSERKDKRGTLASRLTRIDDSDKTREDKKRKRSETPPFSRGAGFMDAKRSKQDEREGSHKDDHRRDDHRVGVEDVPKKSLDQLFKKTVAHPPIYYLPLTEEQIIEKANQKKQKEAERVSERAGRFDRERDRSRGERNERNDRRDRSRRRD